MFARQQPFLCAEVGHSAVSVSDTVEKLQIKETENTWKETWEKKKTQEKGETDAEWQRERERELKGEV